MEKTRDQVLMEKLRQVSRVMRGSKHRGPMGGPGRHHGPMGGAGFGGFGPGRGPMGGGMGAPFCGRGPMGGHMAPHGPGMGGPGRSFGRDRVLMALLNGDEAGMRQKDVAEALGIGPSALSEQLDRLEADRYLERCANPEDRRSTLLRLTEKGRARAYELWDQRQEKAAAFCARLTEEEKDALISLLDKLLAED